MEYVFSKRERRSIGTNPGARSPGARSPGAGSPGARSPGARSPGARSPGAIVKAGKRKTGGRAGGRRVGGESRYREALLFRSIYVVFPFCFFVSTPPPKLKHAAFLNRMNSLH
jgi:hypothetical protein